jgi:uncharacterized membrane protein
MIILEYLSIGIGIAGVTVIIWGVIKVLVRLIHAELTFRGRMRASTGREVLRHQLGSYLLLGLEILIAADVIRTIIHPTLNDVALLGSIVLIRTVIGYFLDRELADTHHIHREEVSG